MVAVPRSPPAISIRRNIGHSSVAASPSQLPAIGLAASESPLDPTSSAANIHFTTTNPHFQKREKTP